jgi:hypothetical protein
MALIVSFYSKHVDPMSEEAKVVPKRKVPHQYSVTRQFFIDCNDLSEAFDRVRQSG